MEREHAVAALTGLHRAQNEYYSGGDESVIRAVLTPEVGWHVPGDSAIAGDYHGTDGVLRYFRHCRDVAGDTLTVTFREVMPGPADYIAALTDGTAAVHSREHRWSTVGLYRLRGEQVAECWLLPLAPTAFDTIWTPDDTARDHDAAAASTSVFHATVRPRHCDAQGMLHASRYYEYFEDVFLDWLEAHIGGYGALRSSGADLVVVTSGCEHRRGAALNDRLAVEVRPVAAGTTSLSMAFTVRNSADVVLAVGHTTYVSVSAAGSAVALPEPLRSLTRGLAGPDGRPTGCAGPGRHR